MNHLTQLLEIAVSGHHILEAATDDTPLVERKALYRAVAVIRKSIGQA